MRTHNITIPLTNQSTPISITSLGDVHLGSSSCDEDEFRRWVKKIADDPNHWTIYHGDMCDYIAPGDRRFDPAEVADWLWTPDNRGRIVDAQYDRLLSILKTIPKERTLGAIFGNHELTIKEKHQRDMTLDMCRDLGVPYLGQEAFVSLTFKYNKSPNQRVRSRQLHLFITHGSGSSRKVGAKANKITDLSSWCDADIYIVGHSHDRFAVRTSQLGLDRKGNLVTRPRLHILAGTFMKTYAINTAGYGARELYAPTSIGPVTITIHPKTLELGTII